MSGGNSGAFAITLNALTRKRAEIQLKIGRREREIERLQTDLVHIDAVIRMFRPDFDTEALPQRKRMPIKSAYFKHGELSQRIYEAMREHGIVTSVLIAAQAMRDKGLDPENDRQVRRDFTQRMTLQLNALQRKGKIERVGRGRGVSWRLIQPQD